MKPPRPQPGKPQKGEPQPTPLRSIVLGTAGHIDHGKTSLVLALSGTDTDRLPEEKARGITIDLGFASMDLAVPSGDPLHISIVDVPGHHAFIRNMLAGTGGIDCALLVIAANEGIKPQTHEHLAICNLLGIRHGLIALTKRDLVSRHQLQQVQSQVSSLVANTFLAQAPILAVSTRTGEGITELKQALATLTSAIPAPGNDAVLRLPLDRAFAVRGFGTVVTGTLQAGTICVGDALEVQPGARAVRVRGIQTHNASRNEARGPTRAALNLSNIQLADVHRGQTLCLPNTLAPITVIDVELQALPGIDLPVHRSHVRVHAFASETMASILLYDEAAEHEARNAVPPTTHALARTRIARLKLREPLLLVPGDRFILRQPSPAITIAGGRVLDATPLPHQRKVAALQWLQRMRNASRDDQVLARVERRASHGLTINLLVAETGLTEQALFPSLQALTAANKLIATQASADRFTHLICPGAVATAHDRLTIQITQAKGRATSRAELASRSGLAAWVFSLVWDRLAHDTRMLVRGDHVQLAQAPTPTDAQSALLTRLEALYRTAALASPIVSEAASTLGLPVKSLPPLLTQLIRSGRLHRMGSDQLLVHTEALASIEAKLKQHRGETFDVARFKSFTGLTRKHAMPLLEYLDFKRIFRNNNGTRTVL